MSRFESRIARVYKQPQEQPPELPFEGTETLDHDFLLYNAGRKFNFARTLLRQYTQEKEGVSKALEKIDEPGSDKEKLENSKNGSGSK